MFHEGNFDEQPIFLMRFTLLGSMADTTIPSENPGLVVEAIREVLLQAHRGCANPKMNDTCHRFWLDSSAAGGFLGRRMALRSRSVIAFSNPRFLGS